MPSGDLIQPVKSQRAAARRPLRRYRRERTVLSRASPARERREPKPRRSPSARFGTSTERQRDLELMEAVAAASNMAPADGGGDAGGGRQDLCAHGLAGGARPTLPRRSGNGRRPRFHRGSGISTIRDGFHAFRELSEEHDARASGVGTARTHFTRAGYPVWIVDVTRGATNFPRATVGDRYRGERRHSGSRRWPTDEVVCDPGVLLAVGGRARRGACWISWGTSAASSGGWSSGPAPAKELTRHSKALKRQTGRAGTRSERRAEERSPTPCLARSQRAAANHLRLRAAACRALPRPAWTRSRR